MAWGKSVLLMIPLILSGIFVVPSPASAATWTGGTRSDWTSVSAGENHTCAIRARKLYCWGDNTYGQVGNGGDNRQDVPDEIGSNTGWTSVSAGDYHTCGIRSGKLYCWGSDSNGRLGNGTAGSSDVPYQVGTFSDWKVVSAGGAHACGIRAVGSAGVLYCWGYGRNGQTGYGGTGSPTSPARITKLYDWKSVSAGGRHTCAIRGAGYLYCWGYGSYGQTGYGGTGSPKTPARITTAYNWKSVSAGGMHTCGTRGAGYLYCWGKGSNGQTGYGGTGSPKTPARITTAYNWRIVSAGVANTCATHGTGALYCWGDNTYGQVYDGSTATRFLKPTRLFRAVADFRQTEAGGRATCGIRGPGILICWGSGASIPPPPPSCPAAPYVRPTSIDLSHWKLTTPLDSNIDGKADEVKYGGSPLNLATLDDTDYFDRLANGEIFFRARANGATTSEDTQYARSELREMTPYESSGYTEVTWDRASGVHRMRIRQRIAHTFTEKPDVVAGQIHDGGEKYDGVGDVLQIRLEDPKLLVSWNGDSESMELDSNYAGGDIDLLIQADTCGITVKYNDRAPVVIPVGDWDNGKWYFKAGAYNQSNTAKGEAPDAYGAVTIFGLEVDHS